MIEQHETLSEPEFCDSKDVTPQDLLKFAKLILSTIAIIFILAMFFKLFSKDCIVFESCKTILPPIATLVIGFYFGKAN